MQERRLALLIRWSDWAAVRVAPARRVWVDHLPCKSSTGAWCQAVGSMVIAL